MANLQTKSDKKYYVPMEITPETIITEEYRNCEIRWWRIGNRKVRTILIPVTKEVYNAYMRPIWREAKRQQRHAADIVSMEELHDNFELELEAGFNLEKTVQNKEMVVVFRSVLATLPGIERTILLMNVNGYSEAAIGKVVGLSQKAVNKRKHKLYESLRVRLKNYR